MNERTPQQRTLRENFTEAERLTRELIEHLEQGFLPKAAELGKLVRPHGEGQIDEPVRDAAIHHSAAKLLASERYTEEILQTIQEHCHAIDRTVAELVGED